MRVDTENFDGFFKALPMPHSGFLIAGFSIDTQGLKNEK